MYVLGKFVYNNHTGGSRLYPSAWIGAGMPLADVDFKMALFDYSQTKTALLEFFHMLIIRRTIWGFNQPCACAERALAMFDRALSDSANHF